MKLLDREFLKNTKINLKFLPDFKAEKTQKLTTLILTFTALSIFGLIAINPTISTIVELNKELEDSNNVNSKLTEKINNLTSLSQSYNDLQKNLPLILSSIPKSPEVPLFAALVQGAVKDSNTILDSLQTYEVETNAKPLGSISSFSFALVAEGSYNDLSNFLGKLSRMQRIVEIDDLSLTRKTAGDILQLTVKGKTFFTQ